MTNRPVIYGAGAIGGLIGAYAQRAGFDLLLVDKVADHVEQMNRDGLHVFGSNGEFTVPVNAATPDALPDNLELVLLAVKGQDTEAALDIIAPKLHAKTAPSSPSKTVSTKRSSPVASGTSGSSAPSSTSARTTKALDKSSKARAAMSTSVRSMGG